MRDGREKKKREKERKREGAGLRTFFVVCCCRRSPIETTTGKKSSSFFLFSLDRGALRRLISTTERFRSLLCFRRAFENVKQEFIFFFSFALFLVSVFFSFSFSVVVAREPLDGKAREKRSTVFDCFYSLFMYLGLGQSRASARGIVRPQDALETEGDHLVAGCEERIKEEKKGKRSSEFFFLSLPFRFL